MIARTLFVSSLVLPWSVLPAQAVIAIPKSVFILPHEDGVHAEPDGEPMPQTRQVESEAPQLPVIAL